MNHLKEFQQHHNLTPDGIIGKQTAEIMMKELKIPSMVAFCHFIAQVKHESAVFTAGRENLNYGEAGLKSIFGKYFTPIEIKTYARQPEKIANRVYANRMGNGNEISGDGWKYRGTGALQLTGKDNHLAYFKFAGLPEDTDPNVLLLPEHYFKTAVFFFDTNNVWQYCTKSTDECIIKTSKKINLGNVNTTKTPIGLDARITLTNDLFTQLV